MSIGPESTKIGLGYSCACEVGVVQNRFAEVGISQVLSGEVQRVKS